ncbi:hypothetical protein CO652_13530 [Rhizobium sp. H4]|nr:hypothetical protein CO652_13530 [Rhizobium sp. H4]
MAALRNIELSVNSFTKTGNNGAQLVVSALNKSDADDVEICIMCESASNISAAPRRQFLQLDRSPSTFSINFDTSTASWNGTVTVQVVLYKPFESRGSNNMIIDKSEIEAGILDPSLPQLQ